MKTLLIDTHLFDINIILFDGTSILREEHIMGKKHNSEYLIPSIKNVTDNTNYDQIIVVNGPGSFTGVRLGVTVAKTLAYTLNKRIIPVTYFDLMALSSDIGHHIFGISDGNGYFIAEYENNIRIKDFYYLNNNDYIKFSVENLVETDVSLDYSRIINNLSTWESGNPHIVNPIYIKPIGADNGSKN